MRATNNSVKERLISFLKAKSINKSEFGRRIGVSSAFITSMRQSMQPDKIERIALEFPELNMTWLLTGDGEMLKSEEAAKVATAAETVPLLPISAQGGPLNDFVTSVKRDDCEMIASPIRGVDFAMGVSGDSMAPEYPSGCKVLVKKIDANAFIEWGRVYVLDTCNGSVVKKIMPGEREGQLRCVSINDDYPPFFVDLTSVYGIYRVQMMLAEK